MVVFEELLMYFYFQANLHSVEEEGGGGRGEIRLRGLSNRERWKVR